MVLMLGFRWKTSTIYFTRKSLHSTFWEFSPTKNNLILKYPATQLSCLYVAVTNAIIIVEMLNLDFKTGNDNHNCFSYGNAVWHFNMLFKVTWYKLQIRHLSISDYTLTFVRKILVPPLSLSVFWHLTVISQILLLSLFQTVCKMATLVFIIKK